ncbi:Homoserine kinase [Candidatus Annandia adelgestsuga]|uniref:Homoserine kinase n=1 Tax=Candidatus Annandia adelgestsuga TaxID=1302411 RepID=A0A3Q9CLW0_9ENTR|nr:homoserine kinase [Candidatus Annandia adelgestsuga]AZP36257.1 Homoserine kinase [Candidatus Annandia adelgestsuga]
MVKFYAPASIGNVGVGFDVLGIAIYPIDGTLLGDCVTIKSSKNFNLIYKGKFVNYLPKNPKKNILYQCWKYLCKFLGYNIPITIKLEKNIPISSGLGSSACSIVSGFVAINNFFGSPINKNILLNLMGKLEGYISGSIHYDNIAPCYLGGCQLILKEGKIISQNIPNFNHWLWVMAYPGTKLSTSKSRSILPLYYSKNDCVNHSKYLSGFIHSCYTKQSKLAIKLMKDIIAEPYRNPLLPFFSKVRKNIKKIGALTCGISGSGPTIFAVCDNIKKAYNISNWFKKNYLQNKEGFVHICRLSKKGVFKLN